VPNPVVLVVGSTMIDLIAYADRLPEAGETLVGTSFAMGFGGKGANQAVAAARLGARVALVNTVGEDASARRPSPTSRSRASTRRTSGACRAHRAWRRSGWTAPG